MRRMTYFVMALAMVLGLAQCKKEQPLEPENETKTVNITLKVGGNGGSRHDINTTTGAVDFQDDDVIYVGDGSTYIGTLTKSGEVFSGDINEPADETEIYFFFVGSFGPSPNDLTQGTTPSFTVDISDQSTTMPVLSCNHVTYTTGTTSYSCVLQNQCALVKFTTASTTDPIHVGGLYTGATINFGTETPGITNNSTTGFVALNSESATEKWAVLLPQTGFNAEAAIAHVGYTATIPTIEADGFITGDAAISISTPNNIVYLDWITSGYTATDGQTLKGTLSGNYQISIASGATVTLKDANISCLTTGADYAGITCDGDATILLEGDNTVVGGFYTTWTDFGDYPGIFIAEDHKLTINGTGSLVAKCGAYGTDNGEACGIGGGYSLSCGNIEILGGTIYAYGGEGAAGIGGGWADLDNANCGDITISGGTIHATGGLYSPGIGNGYGGTCGTITISGGTITATGGDGDGTEGGEGGAGIGNASWGECGDITIYNTVTSVTATKGSGAINSIGNGPNAICGTVEIGGTVYWDLKDGSTDEYEYKNGGDTYLTQSPLVYPAPTPIVDLSTIPGESYEVTGNVILTGTPTADEFYIVSNSTFEVTLDNVTPYGSKRIFLAGEEDMNIKLKGTSRLSGIYALSVTIDEAEAGGTAIVIGDVIGNGYFAMQGSITINGGILKAKHTSDNYSALEGNLTVNGGAVYLAGGGNEAAVRGELTVNGGDVYLAGGIGAEAVGTIIAADVTIYKWSDSEWSALEDLDTEYGRYITTDSDSGDPTNGSNTYWNW